VAKNRRKFPGLSEGHFDRILLIKPSSLGDVLHALPVLRGLRSRFPQARIDWLIGSAFAPLLAHCAEIDNLVEFDRRRFGRVGRSPRIMREFVTYLAGLRAVRYDLVIDLQALFRSGFLARATGAAVRIGFCGAREGAGIFYTHRIPVEDPDMHAVDRNYLVAKVLGFEHVPIDLGLTVPAAVHDAAQEMLREHGLGPNERWVAVVPGARWETKVWSPERFAEVIRRLAVGGIRCVLLGSKEDVDLCRGISTASSSRPIDLAGRTRLGQLAALIGAADVVLCHDSGAMHLAVSQRRALVCLVGPTNPRRTGPYGRLGDVLRLDLDCSPCYLRRLSQCAHAHRCMRDLDADTVVAGVQRALERCSLQRV